MRKASNPKYVTFGPTETVVTFATDRGQLRTNDAGEFFFREMTDGRFTCASPDLERQLKTAGVRAGQPIGITRALYNRSVTWKVRAIGQVAEMPSPVPASTTRKPTAKPSNGLPDQLYAKPEPPAPVFPECEPSRDGQPLPNIEPAADGGLLGRCLCEALNACKVAHAHATAIGLPTTFGPGEIERMAVSVFIERTRNGSAVERKPAGRAPAGAQYVNGYAH